MYIHRINKIINNGFSSEIVSLEFSCGRNLDAYLQPLVLDSQDQCIFPGSSLSSVNSVSNKTVAHLFPGADFAQADPESISPSAIYVWPGVNPEAIDKISKRTDLFLIEKIDINLLKKMSGRKLHLSSFTDKETYDRIDMLQQDPQENYSALFCPVGKADPHGNMEEFFLKQTQVGVCHEIDSQLLSKLVHHGRAEVFHPLGKISQYQKRMLTMHENIKKNKIDYNKFLVSNHNSAGKQDISSLFDLEGKYQILSDKKEWAGFFKKMDNCHFSIKVDQLNDQRFHDFISFGQNKGCLFFINDKQNEIDISMRKNLRDRAKRDEVMKFKTSCADTFSHGYKLIQTATVNKFLNDVLNKAFEQNGFIDVTIDLKTLQQPAKCQINKKRKRNDGGLSRLKQPSKPQSSKRYKGYLSFPREWLNPMWQFKQDLARRNVSVGESNFQLNIGNKP